jgi:PncC family amidohydrolase
MTKYNKIKENIFSYAKKLLNVCNQKGIKLSIAESCTGGMLGEAITCISGASSYFVGGVIAYDNKIKINLLGVLENIIKTKGAVSSKTAIYMAKGVKKLFKTDVAASITGIAGPGGGTKNKPVGLVYIAIQYKNKVKFFKCNFKGNRELVRMQAVLFTLKELVKFIFNLRNGG